jgi:hypothetical protein
MLYSLRTWRGSILSWRSEGLDVPALAAVAWVFREGGRANEGSAWLRLCSVACIAGSNRFERCEQPFVWHEGVEACARPQVAVAGCELRVADGTLRAR